MWKLRLDAKMDLSSGTITLWLKKHNTSDSLLNFYSFIIKALLCHLFQITVKLNLHCIQKSTSFLQSFVRLPLVCVKVCLQFCFKSLFSFLFFKGVKCKTLCLSPSPSREVTNPEHWYLTTWEWDTTVNYLTCCIFKGAFHNSLAFCSVIEALH